MARSYRSILVISDTHFPYHHPDTIPFLKALKQKYNPDRTIHIGDEIDWHSISFYPTDPDLVAPSDELKLAISKLQPMILNTRGRWTNKLI